MSGKDRAIAGLRRRIYAQLRELGIDVEKVAGGDAAAQAEAVHALKKLRKAMDKPAIWPTAPTPERRAKGQGIVAMEIVPGQPKVHATIWPPDQIAKRLTLDEHSAATKLRAARETLHRSSGVGSYGGGGGGGFGRLELTERQQMAGVEWNAMWGALSPAMQQVAENFILETPIRSGDPLLSWVQFGRAWTGVVDDDAARAWAQSAVKSCCTQLSHALTALDRERHQARLASRRVG